MHVGPVSPAEAVEFVRRWHYSGTASSGIARYGWFSEAGRLLGVSIYDLGHHAMRQGVYGAEHFRRVMHHHRLAVHPDVPHGLTSQFLAASLRALKQDRPETWAVVTYAESDQGHTGTIYQAVNGRYTGVRTKGNIYFRDRHDRIHTTHSLKSAGTWSERRREAARRGWRECKSGGKHRYVLELGTARQRRKRPAVLWAALPYPERDARSSVALTPDVPNRTLPARQQRARWRWPGLGGTRHSLAPAAPRCRPSGQHPRVARLPAEGRGPPALSPVMRRAEPARRGGEAASPAFGVGALALALELGPRCPLRERRRGRGRGLCSSWRALYGLLRLLARSALARGCVALPSPFGGAWPRRRGQ